MKGGSIYKEGNKWVWKSPPWKENGKERRTRKTFKTEAEAIAQREKFLAQFADGNGNYVIGMTVKEAYEKWVLSEWNDEEHITFNTQRSYANIFKKHILPVCGHLCIDNMNMTSFSIYLQSLSDKGTSKKTINNIKQAFVKLLQYAESLGWIDVNNADKIKPVKQKREKNRERVVNVLSQEEYEKVITELSCSFSLYAPIVRFLRYTGLRAEELCIKEQDITNNTLKICRAVKRKENIDGKSCLVVSEYLKTSSAYRTVFLDNDAIEAIKDFEAWKKSNNIKSEYVFCTSAGNLIEQRNILRAFHNACKKAGIEKRGLHSLRKLFCKSLVDVGTDWEQIRILMGHESISVSQKYYYSMGTQDIEDIAKKMNEHKKQQKLVKKVVKP